MSEQPPETPTWIRRHYSASPYEVQVGFCRALRAGGRILVSGTAPIDADGTNVGVGEPYTQARRCLEIIRDSLRALGGQLSDVVRTRVYLTRPGDWHAVGRAHGEVFGSVRPVTTFVVVAGLVDPEWLVELEAEALVDTGTSRR